jgi:hypothetical protein
MLPRKRGVSLCHAVELCRNFDLHLAASMFFVDLRHKVLVGPLLFPDKEETPSVRSRYPGGS